MQNGCAYSADHRTGGGSSDGHYVGGVDYLAWVRFTLRIQVDTPIDLRPTVAFRCSTNGFFGKRNGGVLLGRN